MVKILLWFALISCVQSLIFSPSNGYFRRQSSALRLADDASFVEKWVQTTEVASTAPDFPVSAVLGVLGGSFAVVKAATYWKMQLVTASMISGIPPGSKVVEIDAQDGKNIFYLGKNIEFTAVMSSGTDQSPKKIRERESINNQLILECIGKANRDGVNLQGKVRSRTQDIPSKTMDVVMSTGALARSGSGAVELVNEVYRMLRPGGLFVFCDSEGSSVMEAITKVFPATITSGQSAGEKSRKAAAKKALAMEESGTGSTSTGGSGKSTGQKKNKKRKAATTSDVAVEIAAGEEEDNLDEVGEVEVAAAVEQPGAMQTRPGITYERISNLFDPYVTGICVRP